MHEKSNEAVWLPAKHAALEIKAAAYPTAGDHEIVVKNSAVAINPLDWLTIAVGDILLPWTRYPFILGSDLAGEVVEVGRGVTRFKVGDRVLGHAVASDKSRNRPSDGAFQQFTLVLEHMASPIPDSLPYEDAAVVPLGLTTAACALFQKDQLALEHPSLDPTPTGKTVLIWGGSTSVGCNAIQLAVAAGYDVVTTASPKNFDFLRKLGATEVFDRSSRTVVADIIQSLNGKCVAGAIAIGTGSAEACHEVVHACQGNKFVALATPSVSFAGAPVSGSRVAWLVPTLARLIWTNVALMVKARWRGIRTKFIFSTSIINNEVSRLIYQDFLPKALAEGRFVCAPPPLLVGRGLDQIPAAVKAQRQGVSASKLVVQL